DMFIESVKKAAQRIGVTMTHRGLPPVFARGKTIVVNGSTRFQLFGDRIQSERIASEIEVTVTIPIARHAGSPAKADHINIVIVRLVYGNIYALRLRAGFGQWGAIFGAGEKHR